MRGQCVTREFQPPLCFTDPLIDISQPCLLIGSGTGQRFAASRGLLCQYLVTLLSEVSDNAFAVGYF